MIFTLLSSIHKNCTKILAVLASTKRLIKLSNISIELNILRRH